MWLRAVRRRPTAASFSAERLTLSQAEAASGPAPAGGASCTRSPRGVRREVKSQPGEPGAAERTKGRGPSLVPTMIFTTPAALKSAASETTTAVRSWTRVTTPRCSPPGRVKVKAPVVPGAPAGITPIRAPPATSSAWVSKAAPERRVAFTATMDPALTGGEVSTVPRSAAGVVSTEGASPPWVRRISPERTASRQAAPSMRTSRSPESR